MAALVVGKLLQSREKATNSTFRVRGPRHVDVEVSVDGSLSLGKGRFSVLVDEIVQNHYPGTFAGCIVVTITKWYHTNGGDATEWFSTIEESYQSACGQKPRDAADMVVNDIVLKLAHWREEQLKRKRARTETAAT